jgi:hypothetical protein
LEPKLAAGPASGYPQNYNQTPHVQNTVNTQAEFEPIRMTIENVPMQPTEAELAEI